MGVILAHGILNCGGKNANIKLQSPTGHNRPPAIAGLVLFLQFWYWFPMTHCLSLALQPTGLIGVNNKLELPGGFNFMSYASPSQFAYTPNVEPPNVEKTTKVSTVVLSTTNRAKAR
mmetsp:Transcript_21113/g.3425  ORF Transcript_21113/g.3425 Transcript_21113/m.3425 type:complete len:117 (+) Transcript_21113:2067-2417(+)